MRERSNLSFLGLIKAKAHCTGKAENILEMLTIVSQLKDEEPYLPEVAPTTSDRRTRSSNSATSKKLQRQQRRQNNNNAAALDELVYQSGNREEEQQ